MEEEKKDESDTEPDADALLENSGPRGRGQPLHVGSFEKRRELVDGAGLCSLGKWVLADRPITQSARLRRARTILWQAVEGLQETIGVTPEQLFDKLSKGEVESDPFGEVLCSRLRNEILLMFEGLAEDGRPRQGDRPQPIQIRLLQTLLREGGDPDASGMGQLAIGVKLGVGSRMPRTPAVYPRKTR